MQSLLKSIHKTVYNKKPLTVTLVGILTISKQKTYRHTVTGSLFTYFTDPSLTKQRKLQPSDCPFIVMYKFVGLHHFLGFVCLCGGMFTY